MEFEKALQHRSRILIHSLIISGTLNIALIATFVTSVLKERKEIALPVFIEEAPKRIFLTNQEVLASFLDLSYEELVKELYDETHVEEGQRRCDLALAFLGAFHHFDVEKALSTYPVEKRSLVLQGGKEVILYPGLSAGRLDGVRHFARTEVWPLTPEGLFKEIQRREMVPPSLKEAFVLTTDYFVIKRAFHRLPYTVAEEDLFSLITQVSWEEVQKLSTQIQNSLDGTILDLTTFLLPCIEKDSQLAAHLLVLLEKDFALKQLDDTQMEKLLSLLTDKTGEIEVFLQEVQGGLRSDAVRELAGKPEENPLRRHTVQQGDSLWKIARDYGVKVEVIQEMNALETESLKPGMELTLPPKKGDQGHRDAKDYTLKSSGSSSSSL